MTDTPDTPDTPRGRPADEQQRHFLRLLTQHQRRIYAYIFTLIPNRDDAEDLTQEVSITLWEKFDTFEPGTDFMAWAMRVAYLKVQNARRKYSRSPLIHDDAMLESLSAKMAVSAADLDRRHEALDRCLTKLSNRDRELVMARYQPNASIKQLAAQAGRPVQVIYKTLARIRRDLLDCVNLTLHGGRS